MDDDHADDLCRAIKRGISVPRPKALVIPGKGPCIYDGFHTLEGYRRAGYSRVPCELRNGTWDEAMILSACSNQEHKGKKRTREDKIRAVKMIRSTALGKKKTFRAIAAMLDVADTFVAKVVRETEAVADGVDDTPIKVECSDGRVRSFPNRKGTPRRSAKVITPEEAADQRNAILNGAPVFDWDDLHTTFGRVVRKWDDMRKAYPAMHGPQHKAGERFLGELAKLIDELERTVHG